MVNSVVGNFNNLVRWLIGLAVLSVGVAAHAMPVFSVDDGGGAQTIDPIADTRSAAQYYDLGNPNASGSPDFGTSSNTAYFWLYEETDTGLLSIGMIFDHPSDGSSGSVGASATLSGATQTIVVADDASEGAGLFSGGTTWNWVACCTDGAVYQLGNVQPDWSFSFTPTAFSGISSWVFVDGPNPAGDTFIPLNLTVGNPLVIGASTPAPVMEPATLVLFGFGLLGIGVLRRWV